MRITCTVAIRPRLCPATSIPAAIPGESEWTSIFNNQAEQWGAFNYDDAQDAREPVTAEFLSAFDAWIEEAMADGRKVALRCRHGWHQSRW